MQCDRAQEQYSDYLEGILSPAMRQVFEQHVSGCDSCRADVEGLRAVYSAFELGLPTVEAPPGFRAGILNAIREQPANESFLNRVGAWFRPGSGGQPRRSQVAVAAGAALLVAVGGGNWLNARFGHTGASTTSQSSAALIPWGSIPVRVQNQNGILQGVRNYASGGDTYHVFGLHLPDTMTATSASAYVIQAPAALSSDAALNNPSNATRVWSGSIEPNISVQVPVAVVSDVPPGTSLTLLVEWNDMTGEHREVCILPISKANRALVVNSGEPLEQALDTVAVAYSTPIMLNDAAVSAMTQPTSQGLNATDTAIDESLADLVQPANLTFRQQADGSYLIDNQ